MNEEWRYDPLGGTVYEGEGRTRPICYIAGRFFGDPSIGERIAAAGKKIAASDLPQEAKDAVEKIVPTHRHWKGGLYRVLHHATYEATMTDVVVYQSCEDGRVWVRTKADFEAQVEGEPRFKEIL